jgi:magnesium transporter
MPASPSEAWRMRDADPGSFVWIGLFDPGRDELAEVQRAFAIHELAAEDMIGAHERPKLELYGDGLLIVLKPARYLRDREEIALDEVQMLAGPGFLLAVGHGSEGVLGDVRQHLEETPAMLAMGPFAALHGIADRIVDDYAQVMHELEADVHEVEEQVFSEALDRPTERIYRLKRQVLAFQQATQPLLDPLDRLSRRRYRRVPDDLVDYFRDIHDHLTRIVERVVADRELLTNILEANLTQISIRQNEDIRRISAWVAILGAPAVIASVVSMNGVRWGPAYAGGIAVILASCLGLYLLFRRTGWL